MVWLLHCALYIIILNFEQFIYHCLFCLQLYSNSNWQRDIYSYLGVPTTLTAIQF